MSYATESAELSAQFINQNFVRKLEEGRTKEAQDEGSRFIRSKMRQDSFAREILEPVELGPDEIDRDENTDQPKKIVEKEPDSTATFVTFKGSGQRTWFRGPRYSVKFGKVESQHFVKSKFELLTYQNDIRKILTDNSVKDMADQEDQKFKDTIQVIVDANAAEQKLAPAGGLTAANVVDGVKLLLKQKIPVGRILMTKNLYYDAMKLPATSVGDQVASRHYDDGIEEEQKLFGFPVVTTIKHDIVDDNKFYIFGPENYLGNFFLLQDATLFIKQEADIIEFWSYSAPGIGIGNTKSIIEVTL